MKKFLSRTVASALLAVAPALLGAQTPTGTITGTVTEAGSAHPVAGASVYIPSSRQGAQTNDVGAFTIRSVAAGATTIRVQMIGFEPVQQTVTVTAGGTATVNVSLRRAAVSLSEVVVTATGEERKKEIGNSIATIDTAQVQRQGATNTQQILAGSTPGVTVLANSGQPGAGGTVRLRGVNSISQGNSPLIYVDGVRMYNGSTPTSVAGRQFVSPLNDIPAEDIDRIEVVKGPAATTLYGTEASGGVIQIFTKRGREGAHWNVDLTTGFTNMGHVGPKSDPTGLGFNECRGPNLVNGDGVKFEDATCPSNGSWLHNGPIQRAGINVRGGAGNVTYFASGNYNLEHGVLPTGGNRDQSLRANISFVPTKPLTIDLNSSLVHRRVDWFPDGNSSNGALLNISRGPGSNFKGPGCSDPAVTCLLNDSIFTSISYTASNHFVTGATMNYQPIEKWSTRLAVGYDYNDADITTITPFGHLRVPLGQYFETLWNRQLLTFDLASTFRQPLGTAFGSTTSIGGQAFDSRVHSTDLETDNFAGPGDPTLVSGSLRTINDVNQQRVINAGFFGQEMVSWRDLLFVTGGLRVDGNSAFGKSFGLQSYPKLSASYVLSDENFWPFKNTIETLKLRGALGESGKAPGAFDAVRTWDPVAAENGQPAFTPSQVGNKDLGPERTREIELGFDAGALDGRLGVVYTYFNQRTDDALIPVQQAPSLGFAGSQLINVGRLMNHGNEVQLTGELIRRNNIGFTAKLNYTTFNSKAGNLGANDTIVISALNRTDVVKGYPVPSYFGPLVTNGDDFAAPIVVQNQYLGATYPTKIISPNLTLKLFNQVTFDALGEWQRGGHNLNAVGYQNANLHSWQPCYGIQAKLKAAAAGDANALNDVTALDRLKCTLTSSQRDYAYWVESADFFKLRSVSVTWDVPERIAHTKGASLTFAGRNLLTRTNYDGTDPEVSDQRDATFSRRDYYVFPTYRTFTVTLRASF